MKFLIIRFSSIGDIVLTTPVVRCLKQQMPDAEIHFLAKSTYLQILASNPYIDKVHYLEQSLQAVIKELQRENFDYVIDLHHNLRSMKVKDALKVKSFSYNKLNVQKWIYTSFKFNMLPKVHIVDRYMETVESFGVKNDGAGLDYFIAREDVINAADLPMSHSAGYVGVVIGAALNTKKYPFHHLKKLCELLDHPIVLLGGLEDADEGDRIAAADHIKIYNACGKFGLNESADLVRKAKLVVTNDTGSCILQPLIKGRSFHSGEIPFLISACILIMDRTICSALESIRRGRSFPMRLLKYTGSGAGPAPKSDMIPARWGTLNAWKK